MRDDLTWALQSGQTHMSSNNYVEEKVKGWSADVTQLAKIAQSQPHAAYSAFNKGLASRWIYVLRTVPGIADLLQPLEDVIRFVFIPALTGRAPPNDIKRNLFVLPPRWGGLGLCNPVCLASHEYDASLMITEPLCKLLLSHDRQYPEVKADQLLQKSTVRSLKQQCYSRNSSDLHQQLSPSLQLAVNLATEKGASSWLTTLPLEEYGFALHKSAFQDALALRYGWVPLRTPAHCACGSSFSVDHALSCPKGGLPSIRHNEIRDLTAKLLTEVCSQVATEPELQPVSSEEFSLSTANTQDGARLDIVMNGFWGGRSERAFVDIRVFNPFAPSNNTSSLPTCYKKHENIKKRAYGQRIRENEHASFTPVVLSATGGLAHEATFFYKRLASLLSHKWGDEYSSVMGWLRCSLSFSLLRSAIQCIRGARSSIGHYVSAPPPMDLVRVESNLTIDSNDTKR